MEMWSKRKDYFHKQTQIFHQYRYFVNNYSTQNVTQILKLSNLEKNTKTNNNPTQIVINGFSASFWGLP